MVTTTTKPQWNPTKKPTLKKKKKRTPQSNLLIQRNIAEVVLHIMTAPPWPAFYTVMIICSAKQACGHIWHPIISFAFLESDPVITGAFSGCLLFLCKWTLTSSHPWEMLTTSSLQMLSSANDSPATHGNSLLLHSASCVSSLQLPVIAQMCNLQPWCN